MLNGLVLARISVTLHEKFARVIRKVIRIDQTVGVVSTGGGIGRRALTTSLACKIGVQNFVSLRSVALVDHAKSRNHHKAVPIRGIFSPSMVIP